MFCSGTICMPLVCTLCYSVKVRYFIRTSTCTVPSQQMLMEGPHTLSRWQATRECRKLQNTIDTNSYTTMFDFCRLLASRFTIVQLATIIDRNTCRWGAVPSCSSTCTRVLQLGYTTDFHFSWGTTNWNSLVQSFCQYCVHFTLPN